MKGQTTDRERGRGEEGGGKGGEGGGVGGGSGIFAEHLRYFIMDLYPEHMTNSYKIINKELTKSQSSPNI